MRVLLPRKFLKGIIAFLLFLIGTAALLGATLPASFQQQIGLSPSGSIFADLFNLQPTNPFVVNYAPSAPLLGNPAADIDQCANDPAPSPSNNGCNTSGNQWVNGNLGASKSVYLEGDSIPYRLKFTNLPLTSHTVIIEWDTTKSSKHALDYITNWNQSVLDANPCLGVSGCTFPGVLNTNYTEADIPADPQVAGAGVTQIPGKLRLYGGTINSVSASDYSYPNGSGFSGDKSTRLVITFTAGKANPVLAWGGHIATRKDWGDGNSAVAISGSPYHSRLIDLDGSGGNQDRSLSAEAVIFPGSVTIIKDRIPNGLDDFVFTATGAGMSSPFTLDDDSGVTGGDSTFSDTKLFDNITTFGTKTVTETANSAFILSLANPPCTVTSPNGGSSSLLGTTGVTIDMKEGEKYTCIFTNTSIIDTNGRIIVKKVTVPSGDAATFFKFHPTGFPGGSDFTADFSIKEGDANAKNSCQTAGINCLPPSVSDTQYKVTEDQTFTPSYTLTKKECVSSDPLRPNSDPSTGIPLVGGEVVTCTFTNTLNQPALTIDKVATESGFSKVGDVIHYTITVKNTGNVTLPTVTVTDPNASGLSCTPANGSSLAPNDTMACTASHTITQADLDAGSYYNQACADDNDGAGKVCDDVTTPGTKNPALTIDKVATESGYSKVGDVIHYTITATNSGNVTLNNVTVTDAQVSDLSCTPTTPVASLAPGASITCTATHTIVQADLDAGSFYNQACVDDGAGGAAKVCDDVTTPGTKNPHLAIDKVATETGFSAVGDVIHYTITTTNDGNVTLASVTVTDAQVSNLSCTPANGSSLAPGASMTCTASHTITQADLDAGSFYNQACVDDGAGGATSVCDDVTTPGTKNPHLTIDKNATETGFSKVGDVIHYSITATNDGNVTLSNVTVTDSQVSDLSCTPTTPVASLAPGASITCTASHTITQADLDAGTFYNQACVDDGAGGAASVCDDVTTPGTKDPKLTIDKVATESGYSKVGDVIHYTITAKNTGNVTLASVTVTDAQVGDLSCTPANGSSLAPGDSMVCTATHTIVQADLDAGSFYNQACVDDGAGGAASVCDDVTTPGTKDPKLSITKVATESGFSAVGDIIHYTIVATNTGNVTLSNVTVTDPNVSNLSCSPSNPVASLAPGGTITCTASHTIVQADLEAGSFYNQACVDDGAGGAASKCADVTTPGTQIRSLSIVKKTNGTDNNLPTGPVVPVGSTITWTYEVTNTGNVSLTNIAVTDDKLADSAIDCGGGSNVIAVLLPGGSATCTATGTAVAGQYTNTGTATSGTTTASDPDNYFGQTANVSGSYPTQTTCQQFISNTIQPQEDGTYGVKSGKINNASPGVIFYYTRWTPNNSTEYIDQAILSDAGFTQTLTVQSVGIFKAADCSSAPGTATTPAQVDSIPDPNGIKLTGLTVGLEYVVAVKYSPSSLRGATPPTGGANIVYQFQTRDNLFNIVAKDDNGFTLTLK